MMTLAVLATAGVIELATIHLADGKTEADLLAASQTFQTEFLDGQPGFIHRNLVRKEDGSYMDIIHWHSKAAAAAVFAQAEQSPIALQYFSVMKFDPDAPDVGMEHVIPIAAHYSE